MTHTQFHARAGLRRVVTSSANVMAALVLAVALGGCASVTTSAAKLSRVEADNARSTVLTKSVVVKLDTGYERVLPEGSVWREAGSVPEGAVYRPVGRILTVEGSQVHEAWLVVSHERLVGFYLPGEAAYSPLSAVVSLNLKEKS